MASAIDRLYELSAAIDALLAELEAAGAYDPRARAAASLVRTLSVQAGSVLRIVRRL